MLEGLLFKSLPNTIVARASFVQDLQLLCTTVPGRVTMSKGGVITLPTPVTVDPSFNRYWLENSNNITCT